MMGALTIGSPNSHSEMRYTFPVFLIVVFLYMFPAQTADAQVAVEFPVPAPFDAQPRGSDYACDPETCLLPDCHCASVDPPGGLLPAEIPQFLLLTYDDCVDENSQELIQDVQAPFVNPDGKGIPATYFVNVVNCWGTGGNPTDPDLVRALYLDGNEVGHHTYTHNTSYNTPIDVWEEEFEDTHQFLLNEANIPEEHITGFRAPYLQTNESLYEILEERGFLYDTSLMEQPLYNYSMSDGVANYVWPHTFDYPTPISCGFFPGNECPLETYAGLWNIPLYLYLDPRGSEAPSDSIYYGAMDPGTGLSGEPIISGDQLHELLMWNFEQRYNGNRSPVNVFLHASQLVDEDRRSDMRNFLETMLDHDDVWAITLHGLIRWMREPVPTDQMHEWYENYCTEFPCRPFVSSEIIPEAITSVSVYPNPTLGRSTFDIQLAEPNVVTLEIFDILGRRHIREEHRLAAGTSSVSVSLASLPQGMYVYRVRYGNEVATGRLTKL